MTIKERLEKYCIENGLWPKEAHIVLENQIEESDDDMKKRFNESIHDYPKEMIAVLIIATNRHALKYIDENNPEHFARPMFVIE